MIARSVVIALAVAIGGTAGASPNKVLVLPTGGDADAALRHRLDPRVQALAHGLDGDVSAGGTTFGETAAAVGCDPSAADCADQVLATLGVDELVWATATTKAGVTTVTVERAAKGTPPRSQAITLQRGDDGSHADAELQPLFAPVAAEPPPIAPTAQPAAPRDDATQRDFTRPLGITGVAVGGVALIVGVALWASASGVQGQINSAPLETAADVQNVLSLQAKADNYATSGNVLVVSGALVAGAGALLLYLDHRHQARVAPIAVDHGAGIAVTFGAMP